MKNLKRSQFNFQPGVFGSRLVNQSDFIWLIVSLKDLDKEFYYTEVVVYK